MRNNKKYFPIYKNNPDLAYFDSGATALKPQIVLDKMMEYYTEYSANIHRGIYSISEKATEEYEKAREKMAEFIGAETEEVVFTRGTTESINLVARGWEKNLFAGDEIVATVEEHHANLIPWQELAKRKDLRLSFLEIDNYRITDNLESMISKKTKILAITQVSNVLGIENPIEEIIRKAREISPEIVVVVDGAQAIPHLKVEVKKIDADFYAFSGHKMYGPTGIGVLYGKKELLKKLEPLNFGGGMIKEVHLRETILADYPDKFEGGTPPIAEAIGLGMAVDFMKTGENEEKLIGEMIKREFSLRPWIKIMGGGENIFSIIVEGIHPHDVAAILAGENVAVRAGHHCAMPLHEFLGIGATTRISLGVYNDEADVKKLVKALDKVWMIFTKK